MYNGEIRGYFLDRTYNHRFWAEEVDETNPGFLLVADNDKPVRRLSGEEIRLLVIEHLHANNADKILSENLNMILNAPIWEKRWAYLEGELVIIPQQIDNLWPLKGYYLSPELPRTAEISIK